MIHQTYTARKPPKTPPGSHEIGPSAAAARCLQRAHTIRTHPGGVGSTERVFCPWWLWPLTLIFEFGRDFCTMHLTAKFHGPTFNRSEVIVRTNKLTNKQTDAAENIHLAPLCYAEG